MLRHHTKSKPSKLLHSIPIICILALLTLSLITINPWESNYKQETYAAELTSSTNDTSAALIVDDGNIEDVILAESGVNYKSHNIKIKAANVESYTLQISASSNGTSELKLDGGNTTIPGAGGVVGSNMPTNTWGYAWGAENATEDSMTYYTLPAYGSVGTTISTGLLASDTPTNNTIDTSNKLSFAANFSDNISSGHYTTSVLLSLAIEPKKLTEFTIDNMQDMTSAVCDSVKVGTTKQLKDTRNQEYYVVTKLADNNCWMTQNLKLVDKTITPADSDVTNNFAIPISNKAGFSYSDQNQVKAYIDSTYGAYYNWYTATAGTGNASITVGGTNAPKSICPKGWQLPTSGNTDAKQKSFDGLTTAYSIGNDSDGSVKLRAAPLNFVYGGYIGDGNVYSAGSEGRYWSSTADSSSNARFLYFTNRNVGPSGGNSRFYGYAVRCVAK